MKKLLILSLLFVSISCADDKKPRKLDAEDWTHFVAQKNAELQLQVDLLNLQQNYQAKFQELRALFQKNAEERKKLVEKYKADGWNLDNSGNWVK